jgi:glycerol-3-phosphate O-acyltransferase
MLDFRDTEEYRTLVRALSEKLDRPNAEVAVEVDRCLEEMAVKEGRFSVAGWDRFCRWLSRAYRVDYIASEVEHLAALNQRAGLIFLPNHRSYLDTMVLRSALMVHGFPPNNVLGGANLAIWPFSKIGQRNGIVFIRREFKDDAVYRATLKGYLAHLMREKHNLEWYIEGGRTRTGKLRPPRYGVLSYVMDAFEEEPDHEVYVVPVSVIYDQQHEVEAISAEELGGRKKPESVGWMYRFSTAQSRRLGRAYLRFGQEFSLTQAVALTADEHGALRPRLAVPKVAFEVANRINAVAPITPGALVTFALLDNGDRAITIEEGRDVLQPLYEYIRRRDLPMTEQSGLATEAKVMESLDRLVAEGVVEKYDGGHVPVYSISLQQQHEAAFYRNTVIHWFLNRAIAELAALSAAEDAADNIPEATWNHARRLKDLLKFEFFFPSTREFAEQIAYETALINPDWRQQDHSPQMVLQYFEGLDLLLAHRVIGPLFEAYRVLLEELAATGSAAADEKQLVQTSLGAAQQAWLQRRLPTAESISRDYFINAVQLAKHLGLMAGDAADLAERRAGLAAEMAQITRRLDTLRGFAQRAGQPVLVERTTSAGGSNG